MFKAVIFDLDGTLLNTLDDLADSCNYVLALKGLPTFPVEKYRGFVGNGAAVLMTRIHPRGTPQDELDDSLARFTEYYSVHKDIKTKPYTGIPELLKSLKAQGTRLCVLSNKPHEITREIVIQYFGGDTFDFIIGKSENFRSNRIPLRAITFCQNQGLTDVTCFMSATATSICGRRETRVLQNAGRAGDSVPKPSFKMKARIISRIRRKIYLI